MADTDYPTMAKAYLTTADTSNEALRLTAEQGEAYDRAAERLSENVAAYIPFEGAELESDDNKKHSSDTVSQVHSKKRRVDTDVDGAEKSNEDSNGEDGIEGKEAGKDKDNDVDGGGEEEEEEEEEEEDKVGDDQMEKDTKKDKDDEEELMATMEDLRNCRKNILADFRPVNHIHPVFDPYSGKQLYNGVSIVGSSNSGLENEIGGSVTQATSRR